MELKDFEERVGPKRAKGTARQAAVTVIEFLVKSGADPKYPEPAQTDLSRNPAGRES
jgi:hypothetical protein